MQCSVVFHNLNITHILFLYITRGTSPASLQHFSRQNLNQKNHFPKEPGIEIIANYGVIATRYFTLF